MGPKVRTMRCPSKVGSDAGLWSASLFRRNARASFARPAARCGAPA